MELFQNQIIPNQQIKKRMKLFFLTAIIATFTTFSFGQNKVSGSVQYEDGTIAEYCTFELIKSVDSSFTKGIVGDSLGTFVFQDVPVGVYMVRTSQYGYTDHYSEEFEVQANSQIDLGSATLELVVSDIDGATVVAYRPLLSFRDGVMVINVEGDLMSSGSSVLDMLRRIPGVSVDDNGNIMINGKSGVGVMFDGRLQQIPNEQIVNMMANVPADAISSIELIKNPPASYDAKGISGLINIKSKTSRVNGFNGSLGQTVSMGRKFRSGTSGSFNFRSNRFSMFTNISYQHKDLWTQTDFDRSLGGTSPILVNAQTNGSSINSAWNLNTGFEYDVTPRTLIGINLTGNLNAADIDNGTRTDISDSTGIGYDYLVNNTGGEEGQKFGSANLFFTQTLDSLGSTLKYSGDITYYNYLYPQLNENSFFASAGTEVMPSLGYRNTTDLEFVIITNGLDYTKKMKKGWMIETGLKATNVRNNNLLQLETNTAGGEFSIDSSLTNLYDYDEDVYAAYLSGQKDYEKVSVKLGVRAEQTLIKGRNISNNSGLERQYLNLFPNFIMNYQPSEKHIWQVSYSYRLDRPGFQQVIPGRIFANQLSYMTGNPSLNPQYSHNVMFDHFYNYTVGNSLGYTRINNSIYDYSYTLSNQVSVDTTINFAAKDMINYTLYIQKQFNKWYRTQFTGLAMFSQLKGNVEEFSVLTQTFGLAFQMNNDFMLPKGWKIQLSGRYTGPFTEGLQTQAGRGALDLAIRKKFFNDKLSAVLSFSDILFTDFGTTTINLENQSSVFLPKRDSRRVSFSLVYRFGNVKFDRKRDPSEGNDRIKNEEK